MKPVFRLLPPVLILLLTACAMQQRKAEQPPVPTTSAAKPSGTTSKPVPPPPQAVVTPPPQNLWARMRTRFAMSDCEGQPNILYWAHRFTRHKKGFENYLKRVLPTIVHLEDAAEKYDVPSEFVFLPWVESRYRAVPPRRHRGAGMWQITSATAHTLGLTQEHDYDARLDRVAATEAVMLMLNRYAKRWHDWRLVDMAYNAGPYRIRRLIPSGPAPKQPVIPDLSVSPTTINHLTQLLAMACVVRHPQQFAVTLPKPAPDTRLQVLQLPAPSTLRAVAHAAGLPLREVRALNGAYRHNRMPGTGPWRVLLPETAVTRLRQALADGHLPRQPKVYTVVAGDNLWDIAHRLDMSVAQLQTLNHMHDADLHPGQVLKISATD